MVAEQKIIEAKYFLQKITTAKDRTDFVPNLSAFMSSTRSIPDYLLEDYNTKLGLNIPLTERLYPRDFRREAGKQYNIVAQKFIEKYDSEFQKLEINAIAIGNLLLRKRNVQIHRMDVDVQAKFERQLFETIHISDSIEVVVRDKCGNIKSTSKTEPDNLFQDIQNPQNNSTPDNSESVEWFFSDYKNENVIVVCNKYLDLMEGFVKEMKDSFP